MSAPIAGRDEEFYLTDGMTVFQVENSLFRVPQCLFSLNSPIFGSMFSLPHGDDEVEGRSDANPIYLSGVTALEFGTLLQYLFKGMHDNFQLHLSRWIALLSIAHRYEFQGVFKRAIREIYSRPASERDDSDSDSELDDPTLISVAEKYDVPFEHVVPNLVALVMRDEPLTEVEVTRLSPLTVSRLGRAREYFLCKTVGRPSSFGSPMPMGGSFVGPTAYGATYGGPMSYGGPVPYGGPAPYGSSPSYGSSTPYGSSYGSPIPLGSHNMNSFGGPMTSSNPEAVATEIVREIWLADKNDG